MKKTLSITVTLFIFLLLSCNKDDDLSESNPVIISSNFTEKIVGEEFIFQVLNNDSFDVTSEALIKIDGVAITGNTFSTFETGNYNISATHEGFVSENITITVNAPENYSQKVLIENYTGTWTGWAPRTLYATELAVNQNNSVISVSAMFAEFEFPNFPEMASIFGVSGYPRAIINRANDWEAMQHENLDQVFDLTGTNAPLGLSINSHLNNSIIEVDVRVGFKNNFNQNIAIVVCITEKELYANQVNYYVNGNGYVFYNSENPIINFEYNDVLRDFITPILGSGISASETNTNNVYEDQFSLELTNISNFNNIEVVAYVVDTNTKEVINVQNAPVGENKLFD